MGGRTAQRSAHGDDVLQEAVVAAFALLAQLGRLERHADVSSSGGSSAAAAAGTGQGSRGARVVAARVAAARVAVRRRRPTARADQRRQFRRADHLAVDVQRTEAGAPRQSRAVLLVEVARLPATKTKTKTRLLIGSSKKWPSSWNESGYFETTR